MFTTHSLFTVLSLTLSAAAHGPNAHHAHRSVSLPGTWYHGRDHPVNSLFKRAVGADGQNYPDIGSPEWAAKYPTGVPDATQMPAEWINALKAAESAGKIPDIPTTSVVEEAGSKKPFYPPGIDGLSPQICSTTQKCRTGEAIYDGPDGTFATSFDDGPLPESLPLLECLKAQNERATHFLIGITIVQNVEPMKATVASGNDLAVHTYNHFPLTNLSNADVVAQLGWTMQIIHDSTGGKVPKYLRPPYGDADNRVLAIAKEIFGLTTVIWNHDTNDWGLPGGQTKPETFQAEYLSWAQGPKSPGLIVLDHETSPEAVNEFCKAFPKVKENGWKTGSLATILSTEAYQNTQGDKVTAASVVKSGNSSSGGSSSGGSSSKPSGGGSGSSTGTGARATGAAQASPSSAAVPNYSLTPLATLVSLLFGIAMS